MRFRELASIAAVIATAATATLARPASAVDRPALADARPSAAHAEPEARCSIALEPDRTLSATVVDTPLDEVVAEFSRHTGARVRWTEARSTARVTLSFHRLPLTAAIDRLLADHNYILILTPDGEGSFRTEVRVGSAIERSARGATGRTTPLDTSAAAVGPAAAPDATREPAQGSAAPAEDRAGLETVAHLVGLEQGATADSPLRDALKRALAEGDAAGVARATSLGMGALSDELLERAAHASDALRPMALELLARRAESETMDEDGDDALR